MTREFLKQVLVNYFFRTQCVATGLEETLFAEEIIEIFEQLGILRYLKKEEGKEEIVNIRLRDIPKRKGKRKGKRK